MSMVALRHSAVSHSNRIRGPAARHTLPSTQQPSTYYILLTTLRHSPTRHPRRTARHRRLATSPLATLAIHRSPLAAHHSPLTTRHHPPPSPAVSDCGQKEVAIATQTEWDRESWSKKAMDAKQVTDLETDRKAARDRAKILENWFAPQAYGAHAMVFKSPRMLGWASLVKGMLGHEEAIAALKVRRRYLEFYSMIIELNFLIRLQIVTIYDCNYDCYYDCYYDCCSLLIKKFNTLYSEGTASIINHAAALQHASPSIPALPLPPFDPIRHPHPHHIPILLGARPA